MLRPILALIGLCLSLPHPATADGLSIGVPPSAADIVQADVLPGWRSPAGDHVAALHLALATGWKTYWRAPGEAGIPPQFDWNGSENLEAVRFFWPRPQLFDLNGMTTIGYHDDLLLPMELVPRDPARPVTLKGRIEIGVCDEVCVPVTLTVAATLDAGNKTPDPMIRDAMRDRPLNAAQAGVTSVKCDIDPLRDGLRLTTRIAMPELGLQEFAVIETADQTVWVAQAASTRQGGLLTSVADMVPASAQPFALNRSDVTITVFGDGGRVVEISGCKG